MSTPPLPTAATAPLMQAAALRVSRQQLDTTGERMMGREDEVFEVLVAELLERNPTIAIDEIRRAYEFAKEAHAGQLRRSGEPYIVHCVEAARHLASINTDVEAIQACLLHDVIEDTPVTHDDIATAFGPVVGYLTAGVEKVAAVRHQAGSDQQTETLRKMFLAMVEDIRVIFIKIADRIHNMETLTFHPMEEKRRRIAEETLHIYAPIAERLGIYHWKSRLEDLAFEILMPQEYQHISDYLIESEPVRKHMMEISIASIAEILSSHAGLQYEIEGRIKSHYSIYTKMIRKQIQIKELFDIFALRIIVPEKIDCYTVLGVIHEHFTPMLGRIKDYIAVPKPNGYQSIHTTVLGLIKRTPVEIQIRSVDMHREAEFGVAAHYSYKHKDHSYRADQSWLARINQLEHDYEEFKKSLETELYYDRIYVFTPNGDIKDLPRASTPVDFAFAVHTEIGLACVGAKINGQISPLSATLKSGDVVEIITRKGSRPNPEWLSFIKTSHAKSSIKAYLNSQDREKNIEKGREIINKRLQILGHDVLDEHYRLLREYDGRTLNFEERERLLEHVGIGAVTPVSVLRRIRTIDDMLRTTASKQVLQTHEAEPRADGREDIYIAGEKGLAYQLGTCCAPTPADDIVAYVKSGAGIVVHRQSCEMLGGMDETRMLPAHWSHQVVNCNLVIHIDNDVDSVSLIIRALRAQGAYVYSFHTSLSITHPGQLRLLAEVQVRDLEQLDDILRELAGNGRVHSVVVEQQEQTRHG